MDLKNIIAAITLSAAVIVLYGLFFAPTQEQINNLNNKDEKNITQNTDAPTIDEKIEVKTITREDALGKDNRVFFENAFIKGSISLLGGAIDDLELKAYNKTLNSKEKIQLLNPASTKDGYTFNTGWATRSNIETPNSNTIWKIDGANKLTRFLNTKNLSADAIHGNKSQAARTRALADFKTNKTRILIATDIASRGLDINQLPLVVNYDLPFVAEDYVHRIGRTGRAGASGKAISLVCIDESKLLSSIERLIKQEIEIKSCSDYTFEKEIKNIQNKPKRSFFKKKRTPSSNSSKKNYRFKFKKKETK